MDATVMSHLLLSLTPLRERPVIEGFCVEKFESQTIGIKPVPYHEGKCFWNQGTINVGLVDSEIIPLYPVRRKLEGTYTLEFDGASKGNPGKAGAGAVLRNPDGSVAHKIMKGVGVTTNNVAEYEALKLGLEYAKSQGIDRIQVKGDSNLVCKQVNGDWKTRSKNLTDLNMEAKDLKSHFKEFHIDHVPRASNSEADALANDAVNLPDGKCVLR